MGRRVAKAAQASALLMGATCVLGACSATPPSASLSAKPGATAFQELIDGQIVQAQTEGASEEQVVLLERARDEGEVSYAVAHEALENFFGCLSDAGIGYEEEPTMGGMTYPNIEYRVYTSGTTLMDDCATKHYGFVDAAYQLQPAIADEVELLVVAAAPAIVECLRDGGYNVPADPSYDELRGVAYLALNGVELGESLADAPDDYPTLDCYSPAGLDPSMVFDGPG